MSEQYFADADSVPTNVLPWGTVKWLVGPEETDARRFSAGLTELAPGEAHDLHTHPDSEELLFIVHGEGEQTVGDETRAIGPGELIYVPAGVEHGTFNTGWTTLQLLAVYAPPGPEQDVTDDPDCEVVPSDAFPDASSR